MKNLLKWIKGQFKWVWLFFKEALDSTDWDNDKFAWWVDNKLVPYLQKYEKLGKTNLKHLVVQKLEKLKWLSNFSNSGDLKTYKNLLLDFVNDNKAKSATAIGNQLKKYYDQHISPRKNNKF